MCGEWKIKLKYIFRVALLIGLVFINLTSISMAVSDEPDKKAVILVVDETSLEEILNSHTPSMDFLMENGCLGFMNTRTRSSLSNKGSAYLSLGMGVRTTASTQGGLALGRMEKYEVLNYNPVLNPIIGKDLYSLYLGENPPDGEIVNPIIGDIEKTAFKTSPNYQVGLFGKLAREDNLTIGLLGNSDWNKISRESTMLAMDEKGVIPLGSIGSDLLMADYNVLGGIRLDEEKLLGDLDRILASTDILLIDYGDTSRIEKNSNLAKDSIVKKQKKAAIERADSFLSQVMERLDLSQTLFMVISPNPSKEMVDQGNFGLTPIIMWYEAGSKGLLTSNTTKREGIVTNFDFGPTIFGYFGLNKSIDFIGEPMKSIENDDPKKVLLENQEDFLYLREYRKVFHWAFIILVAISLLGLYLAEFTSWKGLSYKNNKYLLTTIIAVPLTMMTVSLFGYGSIVFDLFYVFVGAFLMGYFIDRVFKDKFKVLSILALATSLFLLVDALFLKEFMIISPLGSDAIAGGRFYGIGNDYMGILLGSLLLGSFSLYEVYKTKELPMSISLSLLMFIAIVGLSPFFGANMGGTLSASLILILAWFIIFDRKLSIKNVSLIFLLVIIGVISLAGLDILLNPNPTHAGKALSSLFTGGWTKLYEIISIKLRQVFWNLINASWNIILFAEIALGIALYRFKKDEMLKIRNLYPRLFKGFIIIGMGSIVVFTFNDTGTIASALMLVYLFLPLGILLEVEKKESRR